MLLHPEETDLSSAGIKFVAIAGSLLTVLGTLGNVLIVVLKSKKRARISVDGAFKTCLAVADTLSLYAGLVPLLLWTTTGANPIHRSEGLCVGVTYAMWSLWYTSGWIWVVMNTQRCYNVLFPFAERRTWRFALGASLTVSSTFFISQVSHFFAFFLQPDGQGVPRCAVGGKYGEVHASLFPWFTLFVNSVFPALVYVIVCLAIVRKLRSRRRSESKGAAPPAQASGNNDSYIEILSMNNGGSRPPRPPRPGRLIRPVSFIGETHEKDTLKFLLVLDVLYIIFALPRDLYMFIDPASTKTGIINVSAEKMKTFAVLNVLAYMNNAYKFFCYLALSEKSRAELKMLCWSKPRKNVDEMFTAAEMSCPTPEDPDEGGAEPGPRGADRPQFDLSSANDEGDDLVDVFGKKRLGLAAIDEQLEVSAVPEEEVERPNAEDPLQKGEDPPGDVDANSKTPIDGAADGEKPS